MIQALAPTKPRGFSWVWLAIVAIAWFPLTSLAQTPPVPPAGDNAKADDKKPAEKDTPADDEPTTQVFTDPNAKKALGIIAPLNYSGKAISIKLNPPDDRNTLQSMASRTINTDPELVKRYVEFFAVELSKREYLNALLNPPATLKPSDPNFRGLERAVDALTLPMIVARSQGSPNIEFLKIYDKALFDSSLPKLLENNYLTRIDAMIVLGMAGDTTNQGLDVYINQLKKPDQVIWVKLWAARGLTNAAQNGKFDIDALKANQAAEALIGFLDDPKLPWPAQVRAIEALGSLRVATANSPRGKIDAASVVMKALADPDAKLEVRAWAAWALGMMKVSPGVAPYNFNLIGYEVGQLAVDLGQQIVEEYDDHPNNFEDEKVQAEHLASVLWFQVYPSLIGEDDVRDSGLLKSPHPTAKETNTKAFLTRVDEQVKAICKESYDLLRAAKGALKDERNSLDAKVAALKLLLEQSSPKDRHLVPGGPEFAPGNGQQVAGAARN